MSITTYKSKLASFIVSKQNKLKQWYRDHVDESKGHKLYEANAPVLDDIQKKIVEDLHEKGISIVNINDLFPDGKWWASLKQEADNFVNGDTLQEYVKRFKNKESTKGFATDHYSKKYLYRKYNVDRKHEEIDTNDVFLRFGVEQRKNPPGARTRFASRRSDSSSSTCSRVSKLT